MTFVSIIISPPNLAAVNLTIEEVRFSSSQSLPTLFKGLSISRMHHKHLDSGSLSALRHANFWLMQEMVPFLSALIMVRTH